MVLGLVTVRVKLESYGQIPVMLSSAETDALTQIFICGIKRAFCRQLFWEKFESES